LLMRDFDLILLDNIQWLDDLSAQILQKRLEDDNPKSQTLILTTTKEITNYQNKAMPKRNLLV